MIATAQDQHLRWQLESLGAALGGVERAVTIAAGVRAEGWESRTAREFRGKVAEQLALLARLRMDVEHAIQQLELARVKASVEALVGGGA